MTEISQIEEMKRYLFQEMTPEERDAFEDRFFEDSAYFYDLAELENDLVDSYVRGKLAGTDLTRFERILAKSPETREKISNARALQTLITEEKPAPLPVLAPSVWERISGFFNIKTSGLRYAVGALVVLVIFATGFLLYKDWQSRQEFAEAEKRRDAEIRDKENQKKQLEEQKRIEEERRQNEANRNKPENTNVNFQSTTNNSSIEDEKRNSEIEKLRRELEDLRQRKNNPPQNPNETSSPEPLLAYVRPTGRGGEVSPTAAQDTTKGGEPVFKITVPLPAGKNYGSYEITTSSGKKIPGVIPEGGKSFEFTLPLSEPDFEISVSERASGRGAESLGTYRLEIKKSR